ncbi:unnamed protein product [Danaus chrysippus]|uniref:(African queen) hypothetical protein n=1 Tax=Danaus chrysippus TaxID=151541 RepID=A0A8J2W9N9_9NEOP|nr:unnamed protein product [Danaus chrysippus]
MSTSSSDYDYGLYNGHMQPYSHIQPLYPGLEHPLVYYAQVEHVPLSKTESATNKQELKGFATWLDEKYEEYLRSNQLMKPNDVKINDPVDKCNRSNTTITIDINTPSTLKSKSESILYILNEKEIYVVPSDEKRKLDEMIQIVDEMNLKKGQPKTKKSPQNDISCQCSDLLLEKVNASSQFSQTNVKPNLCGCVETKVSDQRIITVAKCPCTESNTKLKNIPKEESKIFLQKVDSSTVSKKSVAVPDANTNVEPRKSSFSSKTNIEKKEPPFTVVKVAQTSDHAINLDEAIHQGCPIFLRIICTDKLR